MNRRNCINVLVTAWNDSGAGRFMRLMDGADQIFAFPFELLLGAETTLGIQDEPNLVSGKYRWNLFRDTKQINLALEQETPSRNTLEPSESELKDWLEGRKFHLLSQHRDRARIFAESLAVQSQTQRQLLRDDDVLAYFDAMKAVFTEHRSDINLIHAPCAALDFESPLFWKVFDKVVLIIIDPRWGFGNMNTRNQISPRRYLERWLSINRASHRLKQKHSDQVLILCSSVNAIQQTKNIERAHSFLGIRNVNTVTQEPTILGEAIGETGFPFGGILSWSTHSYQSSIAKANAALTSADNETFELFSQCNSLYSLLRS
jgi:hypothetical protein